MKLRLTEAVLPISKYKRDIDNKVLPTLKDLGFELPKNPEVYNDYIWTYKGFYNSPNGNTIPTKITFSTASENIDEELDNAFMQISISGKDVDLGGINLKEPSTIKSAIDIAVENGDIIEPNSFADNVAGEDLYTSRDGRISKTAEEWEKDFMKKFIDWVKIHNDSVAHPEDEELDAKATESTRSFNDYQYRFYPEDLKAPQAYTDAMTKYTNAMNKANFQADLKSGRLDRPKEDPFDLSDRGIQQDVKDTNQYDQQIDWSKFNPNDPNWDEINYYRRGEQSKL